MLVSDTMMYGHLTAVKHGNGRDWWVITHGGKNDKYYVFLIDPTGISAPSVQQIGGVLFSAQGQVCFSPNGSKFSQYDPYNDLHLFDFDRCSGALSNHAHISINDSAAGGGVAFSANSEILYVSSTKYVYQFDLMASDLAASKITVATWDNYYSPSPPAATTFFLAQLAPDNKIYISSTNSVLSMHVIEHPDSLGLACDVCQHCVSLPAYNASTVPNHPNYHLGALGSSICDSLPTGIGDLSGKEDEEFIVFPNPVKDKMYIKNPGNISSVQVVIYNSLLQEKSFPVTLINNGEYYELNTSQLLSGVYFLEITTEKQKVVKKFVRE